LTGLQFFSKEALCLQQKALDLFGLPTWPTEIPSLSPLNIHASWKETYSTHTDTNTQSILNSHLNLKMVFLLPALILSLRGATVSHF